MGNANKVCDDDDGDKYGDGDDIMFDKLSVFALTIL